VERLADERAVDAPVLERDRFRAARHDGADVDERAHLLVGLDGHDAREPPRQLAGQPACARAEVEHSRVLHQFERLLRAGEDRRGVREPNPVVRRDDIAEGEPEQARLAQRPASGSGPRNG